MILKDLHARIQSLPLAAWEMEPSRYTGTRRTFISYGGQRVFSVRHRHLDGIPKG